MPLKAAVASSFTFLNCPVKTSLTMLPRPLKASMAVRIGPRRYWSMTLPTPTAPAIIFLNVSLLWTMSLANQSTTFATMPATFSSTAFRASNKGCIAFSTFLKASVTCSSSFSAPPIFSSNGRRSVRVPITGLVASRPKDLWMFSPPSLTLRIKGGISLRVLPKASHADW